MKSRNGRVLLSIGASLLILSSVWVGMGIGQKIILSLAETESEGTYEQGWDEDRPMMEGSIAYIGLMDKNTEEDGELMDMNIEDFVLIWDTIEVSERGVFLSSGEKMDFDMGEEGSEGEGPEIFFPLFGVEKRDYVISDSITGEKALARYSGIDKVRGETVYVYTAETEVEEEGEIPVIHRSSTIYYMHPETSIPLNIKTDIEACILFPDFHLLWAGDNSVESHITTVPVSTGGRLVIEESQEVLAVVNTSSEIMNNPMYARFIETTTYYDLESGDPLPPEEQPPPERYVVNRSSYEYVTGMENTARRGFFSFPIGSLEKKDYPLWNTMLKQEVSTVFQKEENIQGSTVFLFESFVDNATMEEQSPLLPRGVLEAEYTITMWTRYFLDSQSSMPLRVEVEGYVYVRSSTGAGSSQLLSYFNSTTDQSFFDNMSRVAALFNEVLLPLSNSRITAFLMKMQFTSDFSKMMLGTVRTVQSVLKLFNTTIPVALAAIGAPLLLLGVKRRKRSKTIQKPRVEVIPRNV